MRNKKNRQNYNIPTKGVQYINFNGKIRPIEHLCKFKHSFQFEYGTLYFDGNKLGGKKRKEVTEQYNEVFNKRIETCEPCVTGEEIKEIMQNRLKDDLNEAKYIKKYLDLKKEKLKKYNKELSKNDKNKLDKSNRKITYCLNELERLKNED